MDMSMLYLILLSAGAIQGIVLGSVLITSASPRYLSNRILALILYVFAYRLITEILAVVGILHINTILYYFFLDCNWIYGGLIYFYTVFYLIPERRFSKSDAVHLIPLGIEIILSIFVKTQNLYWDGTRESLTWLGNQAYMLWMHTPFQILVSGGLICLYSVAALKLWAARAELVDHGREAVHAFERLVWLRVMLKAYIAMVIVVSLIAVTDYLFFDYAFQPFYIYPLFISISILTYVFALVGFSHRNDPIGRYERKLATPGSEIVRIRQVLDEAMRDHQLYRDPTLSLQDVSARLEVKPYQLTEVLNGVIGKTFKEYVNSYRVDEVIRLLKTPSHQHYTLTAIAFEAGFNSKATFNRIFKKMTGVSPGQMRDQLAVGKEG